MYEFTTKDLEQEVRQLATERPDFVYGKQPGADGGVCYYTGVNLSGQGEGCIIGQALMRLGVSREELEGLEGQAASDALEELVDWDPEAVRWFDSVQLKQDYDTPWGEAVTLTDEEMGLINE